MTGTTNVTVRDVDRHALVCTIETLDALLDAWSLLDDRLPSVRHAIRSLTGAKGIVQDHYERAAS